jgi:hypothetical protein
MATGVEGLLPLFVIPEGNLLSSRRALWRNAQDMF